uniref:Retrovirus-related Pol polyprotein from transposon TNT 1-94 n=1 Tax=Cajanus cajan TaxID=3821 RepID=A0A151U3E3_CAJCA|nr:hypothetical protein KK1_006398 [Cajanus cajan]
MKKETKEKSWKNKFPPCPHNKNNHIGNFCWFRQSIKCRDYNEFGHVEKVCKNKAKS